MALTESDLNNLENLAYEVGAVQVIINQVNESHGWNDRDLNIPEALALIHSEISEALEEYRKDARIPSYTQNGKPEGFAIELADAVIRIMHLAERAGIRLGDAISTKVRYNDTRPYRHGGKTC